jgi:hypothetical protein
MASVQIAGTNTSHIAPDGDGVVTGVSYVASGGYTAAPAADGMSCVYTAVTLGTGFTSTVTATNSAGVVLTDTKPLDDVVAAAATNLNQTITNP